MRKRQELITEASSPVRKSVAYECSVGRSTLRNLQENLRPQYFIFVFNFIYRLFRYVVSV